MDQLTELETAIRGHLDRLPLCSQVQDVRVERTVDSEGDAAAIVRFVLDNAPPGGVSADEYWQVSDFVENELRGLVRHSVSQLQPPEAHSPVRPGSMIYIDFVAASELLDEVHQPRSAS